ncbi:ATP-dependent DNA helicase [Rhizobium ruizarguesonis]|uniref:ATP-dependent DNA helicase n=1 Tax=Rhizobium ruizarguesonis TaxID=2081791 RepID=UPI0010316D39|nr:DEAD/DEAH box helicase [Rhizobium ruizarguesonis]TAY93623.1 DUF4145 domain-containing protein [Rhizobium ruizarguesonis]
MNDDYSDSFRFLHRFWPELHDLGRRAEQAGTNQPDVAAIRLRSLTEAMVVELLIHLGLRHDPAQSHFERLGLLENADLLDARLLSKFHAIRKVGNNAAHNGKVTEAQAVSLLEDAWSLSCWFCRFMRPDIEWLTAVRHDTDSNQCVSSFNVDKQSAERQPTISSRQSNVLKFPEERVRRIQEQVSRAMAEVDPRVRQLRTVITLREVFTETLSDDQAACLDALSTFLASPTHRIFLLKGYAGTGKTFLAKGITEYFSAQGRAFRIAAPTGRAAKIISEKTGRYARTVHSEVYDFGDLKEYAQENQELGSETFKFYARIASNRDPANTVYIVDEASLLSDVYSESEFFRSGTGYVLNDLISYVGFEHGETDRKIIFVGDPAQLPPVGMSSSPALDANYLRAKFGLEATEYELKHVLRQKADSAVIRNVMPLRDSLSSGTFGSLSFDFDEDVRRLRSDEVLPLYMATRTNSEAPIVITRSNKEAAGFNRAIRSSLFPGREFVAAGDRLIVTANGFVNGNFLANGEFVDVVDAETMVERRFVSLRRRDEETGAVEVIEVPLVFRDIRLAVSSLDDGEAVLTAKILDDHLHDSGSGVDAVQQRALYVDFLKRHPDLRNGNDRDRISHIIRQDPYFSALRVRFGYAVTCHKAQGDEWENVFVSCPSGQNPRSADYFRWLYTAMTRASGKLYLIDPPEIRLKIAGSDWWSSPEAQSTPGSEQRSMVAGPAIAPPEAASVSPQEAFRLGVLARVRDLLAGTGIEIDDVAHHQYQEAFYLRRDIDTARVNISYNGRFKITGVAIPPAGAFSEQIAERLRTLVGQSVGSIVAVTGTGASSIAEPSRAFLAQFHNRLLPLLKERQIHVIGLKEQAWSQRYTFSRDGDSAVIDVFYDGRDRFTTCMPINVGGRLRGSQGALLPEVLQILTEQVVP